MDPIKKIIDSAQVGKQKAMRSSFFEITCW